MHSELELEMVSGGGRAEYAELIWRGMERSGGRSEGVDGGWLIVDSTEGRESGNVCID